jgi:RimJ/RimL family protein N-acetyltransferase
MPVPTEIRTSRFVLRPWRAGDAAALLPVLEANWEHLGPWIPARVATPAPVPELAVRLAEFGAEFEAGREWRYGMFAPDDDGVLGEVGLYPRAASGRVPYSDADCVELGYWLRSDATGRGLITEASRLVLAAAARLPRLTHVEIRCDARNAPSAAIPKRLGFTLAETVARPGAVADAEPIELQVWVRPMAAFGAPLRHSAH